MIMNITGLQKPFPFYMPALKALFLLFAVYLALFFISKPKQRSVFPSIIPLLFPFYANMDSSTRCEKIRGNCTYFIALCLIMIKYK